jgi:hypothetical protein
VRCKPDFQWEVVVQVGPRLGPRVGAQQLDPSLFRSPEAVIPGWGPVRELKILSGESSSRELELSHLLLTRNALRRCAAGVVA